MTETAASLSFCDLQSVWEGLAQSDPLWAILSDPKRKGGRWSLPEFFKTGENEIAAVQSFVEQIGHQLPATGPALDFGCGVGRLTQAIGRRIKPAIGVDISQGMVDAANRLNRQEAACQFVCNGQPTLPFPDSHFTFIYSSVVLQHIPRPFADQYVAEFVRSLRPGHLAIFQTFDFQKGSPPKTLAQQWQEWKAILGIRTRLRRAIGICQEAKSSGPPKPADYSMNSLPEADVRKIVEHAGGRVMDVRFTNSTDADFNGSLVYLPTEPTYGFVSKQFVATK